LYKIIFRLVRVNSDEFFEMATSRTRGHPFKLHKRFSTSVHSSFLVEETQRVINRWNIHPESTHFSSLRNFGLSLDGIDVTFDLVACFFCVMCFD